MALMHLWFSYYYYLLLLLPTHAPGQSLLLSPCCLRFGCELASRDFVCLAPKGHCDSCQTVLSPTSLLSILSPILEQLRKSCDCHLCSLAVLNAFNYAQRLGSFVECLASAFLVSTAHALITGDINTSASHL